jgi:thioesterase domain-containing protein
MTADVMKIPMKTDLTKIRDLLADLAGKDIKVWIESERLRLSAPEGALTPELRDQLRDRKGEIVEFLKMAVAAARQQPAIVPLQSGGTRTPIYAVPGHVGDVFSFTDFSKCLGEDQPFFALQPPGYDERTEPLERVEDIAAYFADQILEYQPAGPYVIAGHCSGCATAFELARLLDRRGAKVQCVALFGPLHPSTFRGMSRMLHWPIRAAVHLREMAMLPSFAARRRYLSERLRARVETAREIRENEDAAKADAVLAHRARLAATAETAVSHYTPAPYQGRVCLFIPSKAWLRTGGAASLRWLKAAPQAEVYYGPENCNGPLMLLEPDAPAIAKLYRQSVHSLEGTP